MREGLLERIREVGHWRVNYRPLGTPIAPLRLSQCREAVQKSRVSIRGWDFPHFSVRNDDAGGFSNVGDHIEDWTEWYGIREFWRMYRSTQFLFYAALREDTMPEEWGNPTVKVLDVVEAIHSVTEFTEFAHRLTKGGLYSGGMLLSVSLRNAQHRRLVARNRLPIFIQHTTQANDLEMKREVSSSFLIENHRQLAVEICLDLFDNFGWNPSSTQIEADIENFYQQRLG